MNRSLRMLAVMIPASITALLCAASAVGQTYPNKPIRVITAFAGGTTDSAARLVSGAMQKLLGQNMVIEPRPGAQGIIGATAVLRAEPDGYTLYFGTVANLTPVFTKNNPIDASKEFAPVSDSITAPLVFFVSSKLPVNTFQELIAHAKSLPPGTLNNAISSPQQNILAEAVRSVTGITFTTIPYTTPPQYFPLLTTGEISLNVNLFANMRPLLEAGAVRPMFVTAAKRSAQYPNVPTSAEAGIPGFESAGFAGGFWAPRGTPKDVIDKVSAAAIAAMNSPEASGQFRKLGFDTVGSTPEEQLRNFEQSIKFWTQAARIANFQPQ